MFIEEEAHKVGEKRKEMEYILNGDKKRYADNVATIINKDELNNSNYYAEYLYKVNKDIECEIKKKNKWGFLKKIINIL